MNKQIKIIRKWAKLRHPDKEFAKTAIRLYESYDKREQDMMIAEFQNYIEYVQAGTIKPSVPTIPIPVIKNT